MIWLMVAVIVGAAAYAASVVSEYSSAVKEIQPRMSRLRKEAENLQKLIDAEADEVGRMESLLGEEREMIDDMQREIMDLQSQLKEQAQREHELEMTAYKAEFRMSKKKV